MAQHTPGPWSVLGDDTLFVSPPDINANAICDVVGRIYDPKAGCTQLTSEDEANARLIAAAPDLLAALKGVEQAATSFANLARRRGEDLRPEAADAVRNALATARAVIAKAQGTERELTADEAAQALGTFVAQKVEGAR